MIQDTVFSQYESLLDSSQINKTTDPPLIVPSSEENLCETVGLAAFEKHKICIVGGGIYPVAPKNLSALPVSIAGLSGIKEIDSSDFVMVAQAGAIVDLAVNQAREANLLLPLNITSGTTATVGGAYMAGSLGLSSTYYGAFRDAVIGVRCISSSGKIVTFGGRTTKNVTGYDCTWFLGGTMGLFAIASELIIKVRLLPERQIYITARFDKGSYELIEALSLIKKLRYVTSLEYVAPDGYNGMVTVGVGIDGMEQLVAKTVRQCKEIMESVSPREVTEENVDGEFNSYRRSVSKRFVDTGFYTVSVPPSASETFVERCCTSFPDIPVTGHPLMGKFHIVCRTDSIVGAISKMSLALGGKYPVKWGSVAEQGIASMFSAEELAVIKSLKHELDPDNILNSHLLQD
ncbi:MAG: FAD-binding oxidoreductase [Candidatus Latescibacteria bacterium]|nr:FAD-binding oxidoreductase [Candidatus Latescibacterota bacterium]